MQLFCSAASATAVVAEDPKHYCFLGNSWKDRCSREKPGERSYFSDHFGSLRNFSSDIRTDHPQDSPVILLCEFCIGEILL